MDTSQVYDKRVLTKSIHRSITQSSNSHQFCVQLWLKLGNNSSTTHRGTEEILINMRQNSWPSMKYCISKFPAETRADFFLQIGLQKMWYLYIYFLFHTQFGVSQKGLDDGLRHTLRLIQSGRTIP